MGKTDDSPNMGTAGDSLDGSLTGRLVTTYQFKLYEFDLSISAGRERPLRSNFEYLEGLNLVRQAVPNRGTSETPGA